MNRRHFLAGSAALALATAARIQPAQAAASADGLPLRVRPAIAPASDRAVSDISDPYDLRPAVDALLENIAQAARTLPASKPLVVLVGESHNMPSHIALQYMLADRLKQAGVKFACGAELPHNFSSKYLSDMLDIPLTPAEHARVSAADTDGQWSIATRLADRPDFAPASAHTLLSLYRRTGITARFNDASFGGARMLLDEADPLTGALIERHAPDRKGTKIFVTEPLGIELRNRAMVHNMLAHIAQTGVPLYIMPCGRNHIFGNVDTEATYEGSLAALLKEAGAAVLPVYHLDEGEIPPFPPEAAADNGNALVIEGAARDGFMGYRAGEIEVLEKLAAHSHHDIDIFRADKPHTDQTDIQDMLRREAPTWITSVK